MKIDQIINEDYHAFFAPPGLESDLKKQLVGRLSAQANMFLASPKQSNLYFLQNRWERPRILKYKDAKEVEKLLGSFGVPAYFQATGKRKPEEPRLLRFMDNIRPADFLEWTYLDSEYLMVCERHERYPLNELHFEEDKNAPSRAYLKLWELFTRIRKAPKIDETCLDLGSAPGGWTYVLEKLQAKITSVDRAPLDPKLAQSSRIQHLIKDAFSVKPEDFESLDWFFSDVICYPAKLAEFLQPWVKSGKVKNFVCTLKFQAATDWDSIRSFEKLGGKLIHLNHNKHELTWFKVE